VKIGEKIKEARMSKGMTQEDVSKILHVSRSTISSWEVNRTYPDLDLLVALSDLYDISLDVILREDTQMVKKIVHETKNSKKRQRWIIVLLLIFVPTLLFLGYQLWNASLIVSPDQIESVRVEVNGESLNSKSEVFVTLNTDSLHEYSGHWIERTENDDTLTIQLYQSFKLAKGRQETISIPIDFEKSDGSQNDINKIEVKGFKPSDTAVIFYSNK